MNVPRSFAAALWILAMTLGLGGGVASGQCVENEECDDGDVCTYDECIEGVCSNTPRLYGDVDGNRTPNVFDIFCILDLIAGQPVEPECDWVNADIEPCVRNDALNVFDMFAVRDMIAGHDPCCDLPPMVQIPSGQFLMGDHHGDGFGWELPVHAVNLDAFYMAVYEVTSQQYADGLNWAYGQGLIDVSEGVVYKAGDTERYCNTHPVAWGSWIFWDGATFTVRAGREDHPMVEVSWYGAVAYANWRSTREGRAPSYDLTTWQCDVDGNGYRLPTEAEWEYAARGGLHPECTEFPPYCRYPWGDTIDGSKANYRVSGDPYEAQYPETTPVGYYDGNQTPAGSDMANGYGLYDVAGNVWEWCNDWYDEDYYNVSPPDNPRGPASGTGRVQRGGSWYDYVNLRCAGRGADIPDYGDYRCGFRLALDVQ